MILHELHAESVEGQVPAVPWDIPKVVANELKAQTVLRLSELEQHQYAVVEELIELILEEL